jgi:hypothetical protein
MLEGINSRNHLSNYWVTKTTVRRGLLYLGTAIATIAFIGSLVMVAAQLGAFNHLGGTGGQQFQAWVLEKLRSGGSGIIAGVTFVILVIAFGTIFGTHRKPKGPVQPVVHVHTQLAKIVGNGLMQTSYFATEEAREEALNQYKEEEGEVSPASLYTIETEIGKGFVRVTYFDTKETRGKAIENLRKIYPTAPVHGCN